MRGAISKKRGSQPRWPEKAEGMETSKRARKRKLDTAKTDLKPPLAVLRRAGCPSRGGIRRACGELPGRNRWGTQDEPVGQVRARPSLLTRKLDLAPGVSAFECRTVVIPLGVLAVVVGCRGPPQAWLLTIFFLVAHLVAILN